MIWATIFMMLAVMLGGASIALSALDHPLWLWTLVLAGATFAFGVLIARQQEWP